MTHAEGHALVAWYDGPLMDCPGLSDCDDPRGYVLAGITDWWVEGGCLFATLPDEGGRTFEHVWAPGAWLLVHDG